MKLTCIMIAILSAPKTIHNTIVEWAKQHFPKGIAEIQKSDESLKRMHFIGIVHAFSKNFPGFSPVFCESETINHTQAKRWLEKDNNFEILNSLVCGPVTTLVEDLNKIINDSQKINLKKEPFGPREIFNWGKNSAPSLIREIINESTSKSLWIQLVKKYYYSITQTDAWQWVENNWPEIQKQNWQ